MSLKTAVRISVGSSEFRGLCRESGACVSNGSGDEKADWMDWKIKSSSDDGDSGEDNSESDTGISTLRCIGCDCGFLAERGAMLVDGVRFGFGRALEEPTRGKRRCRWLPIMLGLEIW